MEKVQSPGVKLPSKDSVSSETLRNTEGTHKAHGLFMGNLSPVFMACVREKVL